MSNIVIDYISDLNLDSWFDLNKGFNEENIIEFWKNLNPKGNALIIAGNLSKKYQISFEVLSCLKETFYEDMFIVLGNHDYYSPGLINDEDISTFDRLYMQERFFRDADIYYLEGDIVDYYGLSIGGLNFWYDNSLINGYSEEEKLNFWTQNSDDYNYIDGYTHYKDIWRQELQKLKSLLTEINDRQEPLDLLVTHFCPLNNSQTNKSNQNLNSVFNYFNGNSLLNPKLIRNWMYGATGYSTSFDYNNIRLMSNYMGNKNINNKPRLKQFIF